MPCLFDFSDSEWRFGLEGAIKMANAYPDTPLLLYHWGSVDMPPTSHPSGLTPTSTGPSGQPRSNPGLEPGQPFVLRRLTSPSLGHQG